MKSRSFSRYSANPDVHGHGRPLCRWPRFCLCRLQNLQSTQFKLSIASPVSFLPRERTRLHAACGATNFFRLPLSALLASLRMQFGHSKYQCLHISFAVSNSNSSFRPDHTLPLGFYLILRHCIHCYESSRSSLGEWLPLVAVLGNSRPRRYRWRIHVPLHP